mmetsp:Transcript_52786/g.123459  ORF Transcript_52786/g.123459 Transcript_52786/m.123459 type:complete len:195 (-) Transcript_52786:119-703(-)
MDSLGEAERAEAYETLAADEFKLEVVGAEGLEADLGAELEKSRKRPRQVTEESQQEDSYSSDDEEDDGVRVTLGDEGGSSGGSMAYYLGSQAVRPRHAATASSAAAGGIVAMQPSNVADIVPQDETVEATLAKMKFKWDEAEMIETAWRMPNANKQDWFNCGLDERTFKEQVLSQIRQRLEARQRQKIGVVEGS